MAAAKHASSSSSSHSLKQKHAFESRLNREKHVTYWKRCLKTYLPPHYTSADSNRMMLAYFTISALDLLGVLDASVDDHQRGECLDWIYLCQHSDGGFRGSPSVDLDGREYACNKAWDCATTPSTFFALSMLAILRDDFARVDRRATLSWLRKMQRKDGSFGEHLGENGVIEGGMDTRFGFCAAGTRWMLRGRAEGDVDGVPDFDVTALIRCIRSAQTFDGGMSEMPFHEPHGGYTYCALAALALIGGLPREIQAPQANPFQTSHRESGLVDVEQTIRWLVERQTADVELPDEEDSDSGFPEDPPTNEPIRWAGFNGRCNKVADTCYAWWIGGSLKLLGHMSLINAQLSRDYLYDKTQHAIGGFGKTAGAPPDIYHSSLGLAALALMGEPSLRPVNAMLCLSEAACAYVETLPWRKAVWDQCETEGYGGEGRERENGDAS